MAIFECRRCGYQAAESYEAPCPSCRGFYRYRKIGIDRVAKRTTAADAVDAVVKRIPTGNDRFDDTLAGGIVREFVALFSGPRGSGKTTLMMQILDSYSRKHDCPVLFASKEEYAKFLLANFNKVGALNQRIEVMGANEIGTVDDVLERCKESRTRFLVLDSLQAVGDGDTPASAQRDIVVADKINQHCKKSGMFAVLLGHMTKSLEATGSTRVGHDVDIELEIHTYSEKDDGRLRTNLTDEDIERVKFKDIRTLITGKNRGAEGGRRSFWEVTATGLHPLAQRPPKKAAEASAPKTSLKLVTDEEQTT